MKKTTLLFDFDGTLIDTNALVIESFQEIYRHFKGHEVPLETITPFFGEALVTTLLREFPENSLDEVINHFRAHQRAIAKDYLRVFPGIPELLETLKQNHYHLAIVTSRTTDSTTRYANMVGIGDCFEVLVSCDDTEAHKPSPEPVYLALEKLGVTKEEAMMIGDGPFDIKCANNAGVDSVLVGWRITDDEHVIVEGATPDYEIARPGDLIDLLNKLNK